ncbi:hypothetical protein WA158_001890 [Blastocystis sp. Blastoise]
MVATLNLLKKSFRSDKIRVLLKALKIENILVNDVEEQPSVIYSNDNEELNDTNEILKKLAVNSEFDCEEEKMKSWIELNNTVFEIVSAVLSFPYMGLIPAEDVPALAEKKARSDILRHIRTLENQLKETKYLTGDHITIADILISTTLRPLFQYVLSEVERKNIPLVNTYMKDVTSQSYYVEALGETVFFVGDNKKKSK